jgi:hypothetical protein
VKALFAGLLLVAAASVVPQSSGYQVVLTWSAPAASADPVAGYDIYRVHLGFGYYEKINAEPVKTTAYTDDTVEFGAKYVYYVKSVDAQGRQSSPSNPWSAAIPSHIAFVLQKTPIGWMLLLLILATAAVMALYLFMKLRAAHPE